MRLILHADDLGISSQVNNAIFRLMDDGKLTSASILANGPAMRDAVRGSHRYPHCSFGVHLDTTEFKPLIRRPITSVESTRHEWLTQIDHLLQAGVPVTHVDSHHHIHTHLVLYATLKQVCRRRQIHRVRLRHTFTRHPTLSRFRIDNRLYNWQLRREFSCTDHFGAFAAFSETQFTPQSTIELMVHPGHSRYEIETLAFEHTVNADFLQRHQCITYRDLN